MGASRSRNRPDGGHNIGRARGERADEDRDHRVHLGIVEHDLQRSLVVRGSGRGDHVDGVGHRSLGGERGREGAGRLAERLDEKAVRLAGVGAEDRRAARVRHDGNAVAPRERLAAEHGRHVEHLADRVRTDHARVAEECVHGRVGRGEQRAGVRGGSALPAAERPLLTTMTGLSAVIRRAMRPNLAGLPKDSR